MAIDPRALDLIKEFEGYLSPLNDGTGRCKPYLDPVNIPTVGWGTIKYPDGRRVKMSDPPLTREQATEFLAWEVGRVCEPAVDRLVKVPLHPLMRGALVSFAYNCGTGALKSSTLLKRINAQEWADVPCQFSRWRMAGGRVWRGLERRRTAEAAMFLEGLEALRRGDMGVPVEAPPLPEQKPVDGEAPAADSRSFWQRVRGWLGWRS